jgi:hypothetical protein
MANHLQDLREMNHMIELDFDTLPDIEGGWSEGWVRFHDALTGNMICINEKNREEPNEPIGAVIVSSNMDVTIPPSQVNKYIAVEKMKSLSLGALDASLTTAVKAQEDTPPHYGTKFKF